MGRKQRFVRMVLTVVPTLRGGEWARGDRRLLPVTECRGYLVAPTLRGGDGPPAARRPDRAGESWLGSRVCLFFSVGTIPATGAPLWAKARRPSPGRKQDCSKMMQDDDDFGNLMVDYVY